MSGAAQTLRDLPGPIALDGPGASGKSTVGQRLASRLGWPFIDTGLMYRAIGYLALARGLPLDEPVDLVEAIAGADLQLDGASVTAAGEEIGPRLHTPAVAEAASRVAQLPAVRAALVARQRELAVGGRVVMVGRDIGTVVLPAAPLKVFLDASLEERARRRLRDLQGANVRATLADVLADLQERDRRDQQRAASPLRAAPDAHVLQTEGRPIDEVVQAILALAEGAVRVANDGGRSTLL